MTSRLRDHERQALFAQVRETLGVDAPRDCYAVALDMFEDALAHQHHIRAVEGYRRPLDRDAALRDALDCIAAC